MSKIIFPTDDISKHIAASVVIVYHTKEGNIFGGAFSAKSLIQDI